MIQKIVLISLVILLTIHAVPLKLVLHDVSTGARCLDGSPAALYYAQGQQKTKTVLFFQGGGLCQGQTLATAIESCYQRSKTDLGSSAKYPQFLQSSVVALLSSDQNMNPLYHNWNKVFIPYCDGTFHQGSALAPISYKDAKLYFRGSNNTIAHFEYINKTLNLYGSESVVLTGASAGAIATFFWGNYLYHKLKYPQYLLLVPDSGIFFSSLTKQINSSKKSLHSEKTLSIGDALGIFAISNSQTMMPIQECVKVHPDQTACFDTGNLDQYIIPPLYIIESLMDSYALKHILGVKCISNGFPANQANCSNSELALIQKYRVQSITTLKKYASNVKNGVWGISCFIHTFTSEFNVFNNQSWVAPVKNSTTKPKTILEGLLGFVLRSGSRELIDNVQYPNNQGCNGYKQYEI